MMKIPTPPLPIVNTVRWVAGCAMMILWMYAICAFIAPDGLPKDAAFYSNMSFWNYVIYCAGGMVEIVRFKLGFFTVWWKALAGAVVLMLLLGPLDVWALSQKQPN